MKGLELAEAARDACLDRKGESANLVDVRGVSTVTDYYLVVSGSSPPHLKALFGHVQVELKKQGVHAYRKSGDPESGWLVLDYVDVIIHIFQREAREYYAIEALWDQARQVE